MLRSDLETAALLALMLHRSGKSRGRITKRTLETIAGRTRIHPSFFSRVQGCLEECDVVILENSRGGYSLISVPALDGAPVMSSASVRDDIQELKKTGNLNAIWKELEFEVDDQMDDGDD